ncbi:MAG TPA: hypothetical protein VF885_05175 [Arthrobacter sp.]
MPAWLGGTGRKASHRITDLAVRSMFGGVSRQIRAELGLPARSAPIGGLLPAIYGFSPSVVPQPPEWGPQRKVTGYWPLPAAPGWVPLPN